jgi:hypothetical protein
MPALLMSTSSLPKVLTACAIIAAACSKFETSAPFAMASPPASLISATTCSAGERSEPVPSGAPPRSLTTTLAPSAASIRQ